MSTTPIAELTHPHITHYGLRMLSQPRYVQRFRDERKEGNRRACRGKERGEP